MEQWLTAAERIGLQGEAAVAFIREQQEVARIERQERRAEADEQRAEAERQHQRQMELLQVNGPRQERNEENPVIKKAPKLPAFSDGSDDLDSYLQRFERFARANEWNVNTWAVALGALLTGRALEVYSRLSDAAANDYGQLKDALRTRYNLTEKGYRDKFQNCKPENEETPDQYLFRMKLYFENWIKLSSAESTFEGLRDLIIKERYINSCPKDVAIHIRERCPESLEEIIKMSETYLIAHNKQLATDTSMKDQSTVKKDEIKCSKCNKVGHKTDECKEKTVDWRKDRKCFHCQRFGHEQKDCRLRMKAAAATEVSMMEDDGEPTIDASVCSVTSSNIIEKIVLANGLTVDVIVDPLEKSDTVNGNMPVADGMIGSLPVETLRDSGCSGVIVKDKFVTENQYTGKYGHMRLADNSKKRAPMAKILIDTPFYTGEVEAICLHDAAYDLIIGNIPGVLPPDKPIDNWVARKKNLKDQLKVS